MKNAFAAIEGNYVTSSSLTLMNKQGLINADITMASAGEHSSHGTQLLLVTSDSPLNATLTLSSPPNVPGGNFTVDAVNTNGVVSLDFLAQPLASRLEVYSSTSNAGLDISLPPQYSGRFGLYSTGMQPAVHTSHVDDPAAAGRHRFVEVTRYTGNAIEGDIIWMDRRGKKDGGGGVVRANTRNHSTVLSL